MNRSSFSIEKIALRATRWIGSVGSLVVHTILFAFSFFLVFLGASLEKVLLVLTTIVSLEAIYLAIFIQMSVNRNERRLYAVSKEVDEIHEDIGGIQEDVEEITKDVDEIQEDIGEIQEDVEQIEKDVDEIQEDVEQIEKESLKKED